MQRVVIGLVFIAMAFGGGYLVGKASVDTAALETRIAQLEEGEAFDLAALDAYKEMGYSFYKDRFKVEKYHPTPKKRYGTVTARHMPLIPYHTCATDWSVLPEGSFVYVDGQIWVAEDYGGHVQGKEVDLCVKTPEEVEAWGTQYMDIWVCIPPKRSER